MNEPNHQQHELGPEPASSDVAAGHELSDVSIRGLATFLAAMVISLAVVVVAVAGMFVVLMRRAEQADPPQPPLAELRAKEPPAPRLQELPAREMEKMAKEQDAALRQTKWIDKDKQVVQIPIERAMELVAKRGPPDWPRVEVDAKRSAPEESDKEENVDEPDSKAVEKAK